MIPAPQNSLYPTLSRTAERTVFCIFFILLLHGYTRLIHYTQKRSPAVIPLQETSFHHLIYTADFSSNYSRNLQKNKKKPVKFLSHGDFLLSEKTTRQTICPEPPVKTISAVLDIPPYF